MSAPELNRALVLEEKQRLADGAGGFSETWVLRGVLWGAVRPLSAGEGTLEEIVSARQLFRILVRGRAQGAPSRPIPGQRFRDGTRRFEILAVSEEPPEGRYLRITAREEGPQ